MIYKTITAKQALKMADCLSQRYTRKGRQVFIGGRFVGWLVPALQ